MMRTGWVANMIRTALLIAAAGLLCVNALAKAQGSSEAKRLGAFAGAMQYCEDRYDGSERRYRWARMHVAKEVEGMKRDDRRDAIMARDFAKRRGQFLGNKLNERECDQLLRTSEWKRFRE